MKISVCIPTYNRPELLLEALHSCLNQTSKPFEIIIGDDSKNFATREAVRTLKESVEERERIRYYKNPVSLGQAANVNSLIKRVKGDKMVLLHDDDLLLPWALSVMAAAFEQDPDLGAVFGKQYIIDNEGKVDVEVSKENNRYFFRSSQYANQPLSALESSVVQQFPNDCYMVDSSLAKQVKYRNKEVIGNAGDFDFGIRLAQSGARFHYIDQYLSKYRLTPSSVARDGTDSGYRAYKIISESGVSKDNLYVNTVLRRKAPIAVSQAIAYGKRKEALQIYFSKWHRHSIMTPGGFRRLFMLLRPPYN